ncbi:ATP-binding protein [Streptomyces sp. NPDC059874]|uniref:ATP-binding protein n=1 Tax=Streptomyces sp. NPDC059874 TaxID=3346983 RepID=UPI003646B7B8
MWEGCALWIEVRDSGPGCPVVLRPGPNVQRGRGLWLVTALSDGFEIRDEGVGKTARAGFKVAQR